MKDNLKRLYSKYKKIFLLIVFLFLIFICVISININLNKSKIRVNSNRSFLSDLGLYSEDIYKISMETNDYNDNASGA